MEDNELLNNLVDFIINDSNHMIKDIDGMQNENEESCEDQSSEDILGIENLQKVLSESIDMKQDIELVENKESYKDQINEVRPQFEKRNKKRKNIACDLTAYQKQRRDLVQKWKEIEKEQVTVKSDEKNQCEECGKSFSHNEKLHNHIRMKHTSDPCTCPFCGSILDNKSYLTQHIKQFHRDVSTDEKGSKKMKNYMHEEFPMTTFKTESDGISVKEGLHEFESTDIKTHFAQMRNDNGESKKGHSSQEPVQIKVEAKDKDEPLSCPYCEGTILKNKTYLTMHINRFHEGDRLPENYKMKTKFENIKMDPIDRFFNTEKNECNDTSDAENKRETKTEENSFNERDDIAGLDLSGEKIKNFICISCDEVFKKYSLLKAHERVHSDQKSCDKCSKTFKYGANLKSHEIKCVGNKSINSFVCSECRKTFKSEKAFEDHTCEEKEDKICSVCGGEFKNSWDRRRHQRRTKCSQMGVESFVQCKVCGKTCKSKYALKDHTYHVHPSEERRELCSLCGKEFKNLANLRQHQRKTIRCSQTSAETYAVCPECGKDFHNKHALYNHNYNTHMIEIVNCPKCGKTCKSKLALKLHIKRTCAPSVNLTKDAVPIHGIQG